jgi:MFS family permease
MTRYGSRGVFLGAAVPGALAILVAFFGIRETRRRKDNLGQTIPKAASTTAVPSRGHLPHAFYFVLFAVTLFSLGNSSDMFLVMRAENVGIPISLAPLLGLVFNITYTLASWPAGWISDRISRRWIAAAGYFIFGLVYFVFGRAPSTLAIWIIMAIYGLYYALTQPVLKALVVESVAQEVRGRALGIYFFATSVATLAASVITGELWKQMGASFPFYVSAALAVTSAISLLVIPRTHLDSAHLATGKNLSS